MGITKLTEDVAQVSKLGDYPRTDNGLSTDELKAWFDKAPIIIKEYLNGSLVPELDKKFGEIDGWIDTYVAVPKDYVDKQVRKASPYNLLDNSDFRNPVNQRGQSSYTGIQYTIDRWRTWSNGNVTVGDGYINKGNESLWQYLPENAIDESKKYTIALCTTGGTKYVYSGTPSAGVGSWGNTIWFGLETQNWFFRIENGMTENIAWVALYEGEYTADTLPEYHPKGYTVELAECQRYFERVMPDLAEYCTIGTGYTTRTGVGARISINYAQKRIIPTIIYDQSGLGLVCNGNYLTISSITPELYCDRAVLVAGISEVISKEVAVLYSNKAIDVCADL